jgi:hypothetical protein
MRMFRGSSLRREMPEKLTPIARAGTNPVILIGSDSQVEPLIEECGYPILKYSTPMEIFQRGDSLADACAFFIVADPRSQDSLLFIRLVNNLFPERPVFLVSPGDLADFSRHCDLDDLNFQFVESGSTFFSEVFRKLLQNIAA